MMKKNTLIMLMIIVSAFSSQLRADDELHSSILLLNSYNQSFYDEKEIIRGIRETFKSVDTGSVLYIEDMNSHWVLSEDYKHKLSDYFRIKYSKNRPSIIIATGKEAYAFLREYRKVLFADVPVLFTRHGFPGEHKKDLSRTFGYEQQIRPEKAIELILRIHPETKEIFVINDSSLQGKMMEESIRRIGKKYHSRTGFVYSSGESCESVIQKLKYIREGAIVLLGAYGIDKEGKCIFPFKTAEHFSEKSGVPVYGLLPMWLGKGIVGGSFPDAYKTGLNLGRAAEKIIANSDFAPSFNKDTIGMVNSFDYVQVQKYSIFMDSLPDEKSFINRDFTYFEKHKGRILLSVYAIWAQAMVIFWLVLTIRAKRRAERSLRETNENLEGLVKKRTQDLEKTNLSLQESEEKYRVIVERATDGIVIIHDEVIKYINPGFLEIMGYEEKDCIGKRFIDFIAPEMADDIKKRYQDRITGKEMDALVDIPLRKKDGGWLNFEINAGLIKYNGKLADYIFIRDISRRKSAERNLKIQYVFLYTLLNTIPSPLFYKDIDGVYQGCNSAYEKFMGLKEEEMVGKTVFDLLPYEEALIYHKTDLEMLMKANREISETETRLKDAQGRMRDVLLTKNVYSGADGEIIGILGLIADVTDINKARQDAEAANRAKSEFLANMSHEIRTPLNAVIGFTELLEDMLTEKKQRSYLKSIKAGGSGLLTLINDILDLSKIEAGEMELLYEPVNPKVIFDEIKRIFSLKFSEKGIDFVIDIDQEIPEFLMLDEVRLRQVLFNLVGNAIKFTEHGFVALKATKVYVGDSRSTVDLDISIEDSGIGVPLSQHENIFEAFKQQKGQSAKKYGGTGLGLSICRRFVDMMNGEISLVSEEGEGARFRIILHNVAVASMGLKRDIEKEVAFRKIRFEKAMVLVVDDVEPNRKLAVELLSGFNLDVMEAEQGEQAVFFARKYKPSLILMDIRMPVMDGYEATAILKEDPVTSDIPVIALTASVMQEDEKNIIKAGFDGMLRKPVKRRLLIAMLAKYLKSKSADLAAEEISNEQYTDEISDEGRKNLPGVLLRISTDIEQKWKQAGEKKSINLIKDFGAEMRETGDKNSINLLSIYGADLMEEAASFDVEKIRNTMNSFPELVKKLEKINSEENK